MTLDHDRKRLAEWLTGDKRNPLVLQRCEPEYCVCDVLFKSTASGWFGVSVRHVLGRIAQRMVNPVKQRIYRAMGMTIGRNVYIAPNVYLDTFFPKLITIEDDAFLGLDCRVLTHEYSATEFRIGRAVVGTGAVIGVAATIRSGVSVGARATVGAHSFVNCDVKAAATVGGVPAKEVSGRAAGQAET